MDWIDQRLLGAASTSYEGKKATLLDRAGHARDARGMTNSMRDDLLQAFESGQDVALYADVTSTGNVAWTAVFVLDGSAVEVELEHLDVKELHARAKALGATDRIERHPLPPLRCTVRIGKSDDLGRRYATWRVSTEDGIAVKWSSEIRDDDHGTTATRECREWVKSLRESAGETVKLGEIHVEVTEAT